MYGMLGFLLPRFMLASVVLSLIDDLGAGALDSLAVGAIVGAVVWSVSMAPDTVGRVFLFGLLAGLVMVFVQLVIILNAIGEVSMSSLIDAFQSRQAEMSVLIVAAGQWIGITALIGSLLGVIFTVPGEAIKGAIIGLFLGAIVGAILNVILLEIGLQLNMLIFQFVVGLLTWGLMASVGGK